MNKQFVYCVYDIVRCEMNAPFLANNDGHALRIHQQSLKEVPVEFQKELDLYVIGEVELDTMELQSMQPRVVQVNVENMMEDSVRTIREETHTAVISGAMQADGLARS